MENPAGPPPLYPKKEGVPPRIEFRYGDVIMSAMVCPVTGVLVVYSTVCSKTTSKLRISDFVRRIHRSQVNFSHKEPVTRRMLPFDDIIMLKLWIIYTRKNAQKMQNALFLPVISRGNCEIVEFRRNWNVITLLLGLLLHLSMTTNLWKSEIDKNEGHGNHILTYCCCNSDRMDPIPICSCMSLQDALNQRT